MKNWPVAFLLFLKTVLPAQVLTSSNLPIVSIKTGGQYIPDEPKMAARMHIVEPSAGGGRAVLADTSSVADIGIGIEQRGSTSLLIFPKKGFAIETRGADGVSSMDIAPFGFPPENDWVLLGPYNDKSLMRDALARAIASQSMTYAPRAAFIELVIDDDYRGVYLFTEKIKRDKNRIAISKLEPADTTGDDLTGGYIIKLDKRSGEIFDGWASGFEPFEGAWQRTFFQYHYPKAERVAEKQKAFIQSFIEEFESNMDSEFYSDSIDGYNNFIEVNSWIDYLLVNEVCKNMDAYRLSTYLYKDKNSIDGRLHMGPVWDFNIALGISGFCHSGPHEGWAFDFNKYCPDDEWPVPFWWKKLLADPHFLEKLKARWQFLRKNQWTNEKLLGKIDSMQTLLGEAQARNFSRWPVLGEDVWLNYPIGETWGAEVAYLRGWLAKRLEWMDGQIAAFPGVGGDGFVPIGSTDPVSNPARGETVFEYQTATFVDLRLEIFDAAGRLAASFENLPTGPNGRFEAELPGAAGIYFYRFLLDGRLVANGKIVAIR